MRKKVEQIIKKSISDQFAIDIDCEITHPPSEDLGDYSTNVAFLLAREVHKSPKEIAEEITANIKDNKIEWAKPVNGFINIMLKKEEWLNELKRANNPNYGDSDKKKNKRILLEFVSANPTGPLHVASARAASFGNSLASILKSQGFDVDCEYYIDDIGKQVELLGKSILSKVKELQGEPAELPCDGYSGEYIEELAKKAIKECPSDYSSFGVKEVLSMQKNTLDRFRVHFDKWVSEKEIREKGMVNKVIEDLSSVKPSPLIQKDGALWFAGEKRERVFIRSDGTPTYIVPDIAYHLNKFERGFEHLIDLLGPDHIDHIPELKKSLALLGHPEENLEVKIIQWVTLKRGDQTVKMSKRSGEFITIDELIDEVGIDAARFFFLMRKASIPMDFDLDLAKEQSERNPVFYVQYGHARISSLLDLAREKGYSTDSQNNLALLEKDEELRLIKKIPEFKEVLEDAAKIREPHLVAYYLLDLSKIYHNFYQGVRIIGGEAELVLPRLFLSNVVRNVIARGLSLLGVSAPVRM